MDKEYANHLTEYMIMMSIMISEIRTKDDRCLVAKNFLIPDAAELDVHIMNLVQYDMLFLHQFFV